MSKAETGTVESARAWSESKAKEKTVISRIDAKARKKAETEARVREKPMLFRGQRLRLPLR